MMIQGVDDMNYSFDTLKNLYDKYGIEKDSESGQTVVVDRKTRELFAFEGDFAECVKFAHTWVYATRYTPYGNSTSISKGKITEDEYGRAFSDSSRTIYNSIMERLVTCLQESGKMLKCETLIEEIEKNLNDYDDNDPDGNHKVNIPVAENIVRGLFAKKGGYASLFFWCLKIAGMDDILEKVHEQASKQEHALAA